MSRPIHRHGKFIEIVEGIWVRADMITDVASTDDGNIYAGVNTPSGRQSFKVHGVEDAFDVLDAIKAVLR